MAFLVKGVWIGYRFFFSLVYFRANQMELENNFDNAAFKNVDALQNSVEQFLKLIQSLFY